MCIRKRSTDTAGLETPGSEQTLGVRVFGVRGSKVDDEEEEGPDVEVDGGPDCGGWGRELARRRQETVGGDERHRMRGSLPDVSLQCLWRDVLSLESMPILKRMRVWWGEGE